MASGAYYCRMPRGVVENLKFRRRTFARAAVDEEFREELWEACARDVLFWINLCCWGFDGRLAEIGFKGDQPFVTYPFQDEVIRDLDWACGREDRVWEKSRGQGATYIALLVILHRFVFSRERQKYVLVSYKEDAVDKAGDPDTLFWKLDYQLDHLPDWMKPDIRRVNGQITNQNSGTTIVGTATVGDVAVGGRPSMIFFDEFAVHTLGDQMLAASRDATNSRWFVSTHRGTGRTFYKLTRDEHWTKLRSHWSEHPVFASGLYSVSPDGQVEVESREVHPVVRALLKWDDDFRWPEDYDFEDTKFRDTYQRRSPWFDLQCKRAGSRQEIAQELEIDPAGSGSPFFDVKILEELVDRDGRDPLLRGHFEFDPFEFEPRGISRAVNGPLALWCELDQHGDPQRGKYVAGVDIATGTSVSNSVVSIARKETGEKVAEFADRNTRPEALAKVAVALCRWFCDHDGTPAKMAWEMQGPGFAFGRTVVEPMKDGGCGFRHVYYRKREKTLNQKRTMEPGFSSNQHTKTNLLTEYRQALGTGAFTNPCREALHEAMEYQHGAGGKAPEHPGSRNTEDPSGAGDNHGDRVIADALASMMCHVVIESPTKRAKTPEPDLRNAPPGSIAYLMYRDKMAVTQGVGSRW